MILILPYKNLTRMAKKQGQRWMQTKCISQARDTYALYVLHISLSSRNRSVPAKVLTGSGRTMLKLVRCGTR